MVGCFLHDIGNGERTGDGGCKEAYAAEDGLAFFHTYVGAAAAAQERGLLSSRAVANVARECVEDLLLNISVYIQSIFSVKVSLN